MVTTINSIRYENGRRYAEQTVEYTLSDDILQLAQLQNQLGQVVRRMEGYVGQPGAAAELARANEERARYETAIAAQQQLIYGYNGEFAAPESEG